MDNPYLKKTKTRTFKQCQTEAAKLRKRVGKSVTTDSVLQTYMDQYNKALDSKDFAEAERLDKRIQELKRDLED
jgi:hypothetical protein